MDPDTIRSNISNARSRRDTAKQYKESYNQQAQQYDDEAVSYRQQADSYEQQAEEYRSQATTYEEEEQAAEADLDYFNSLATRITYGEFSTLLTGDSQVNGVMKAEKEPVDVLQAPHHGSATGMSDEVLKAFKPKVAVISVGVKNRYGHPSPHVLSLLTKYKTQVKRTDKQGNVEAVSDGVKFWFTD